MTVKADEKRYTAGPKAGEIIPQAPAETDPKKIEESKARREKQEKGFEREGRRFEKALKGRLQKFIGGTSEFVTGPPYVSTQFSPEGKFFVVKEGGKQPMMGPFDTKEQADREAKQWNDDNDRRRKVLEENEKRKKEHPVKDDMAAALAAGINVAAVAPPGMEKFVKHLKTQYPGEPEKAFATAWSLKNKGIKPKHFGKNKKSKKVKAFMAALPVIGASIERLTILAKQNLQATRNLLHRAGVGLPHVIAVILSKRSLGLQALKAEEETRSYTFKTEDVGKSAIPGAPPGVAAPLGRVRKEDVGKTAYEIKPNIWQVETDEQFEKRKSIKAFAEKWESLFFAQGDDADEFIKILDEQGPEALIDYLDSAGALEAGEISDEAPWGEGDDIYEHGGYVISIDHSIPYLGVQKEVESREPVTAAKLKAGHTQVGDFVKTPDGIEGEIVGFNEDYTIAELVDGEGRHVEVAEETLENLSRDIACDARYRLIPAFAYTVDSGLICPTSQHHIDLAKEVAGSVPGNTIILDSRLKTIKKIVVASPESRGKYRLFEVTSSIYNQANHPNLVGKRFIVAPAGIETTEVWGDLSAAIDAEKTVVNPYMPKPEAPAKTDYYIAASLEKSCAMRGLNLLSIAQQVSRDVINAAFNASDDAGRQKMIAEAKPVDDNAVAHIVSRSERLYRQVPEWRLFLAQSNTEAFTTNLTATLKAFYAEDKTEPIGEVELRLRSLEATLTRLNAVADEYPFETEPGEKLKWFLRTIDNPDHNEAFDTREEAQAAAMALPDPTKARIHHGPGLGASTEAWDVYLDGDEIDTVYGYKGFTEAEVRKSLIEHDGYDSGITVVKASIQAEGDWSDDVDGADVRVYDNGGETADRYTIVVENPETLEQSWLGSSEDPFNPQGYGEHVGDRSTGNEEGEHLGKRIKFSELPKQVQKFVKREVEGVVVPKGPMEEIQASVGNTDSSEYLKQRTKQGKYQHEDPYNFKKAPVYLEADYRRKPKTSEEARDFISRHVGKHIKKYKQPQDQAVAVALSEAREKGYKVPKPPVSAGNVEVLENPETVEGPLGKTTRRWRGTGEPIKEIPVKPKKPKEIVEAAYRAKSEVASGDVVETGQGEGTVVALGKAKELFNQGYESPILDLENAMRSSGHDFGGGTFLDNYGHEELVIVETENGPEAFWPGDVQHDPLAEKVEGGLKADKSVTIMHDIANLTDAKKALKEGGREYTHEHQDPDGTTIFTRDGKPVAWHDFNKKELALANVSASLSAMPFDEIVKDKNEAKALIKKLSHGPQTARTKKRIAELQRLAEEPGLKADNGALEPKTISADDVAAGASCVSCGTAFQEGEIVMVQRAPGIPSGQVEYCQDCAAKLQPAKEPVGLKAV